MSPMDLCGYRPEQQNQGQTYCMTSISKLLYLFKTSIPAFFEILGEQISNFLRQGMEKMASNWFTDSKEV